MIWLNNANADQLPANFDFYDLLKEPEIVSSYESCLSVLKYYNAMKSSSSQSSSSEESYSSEESSSEESSSKKNSSGENLLINSDDDHIDRDEGRKDV